MADEEINNKKATEIYYPDADGSVKWSDDLPSDGRKTLGEWLNKLTETNIEPVPPASADATMDIDNSQHPYVDPSSIKTVYSETAAGVDIKTDVVKLGPDGNALKLLHDVTPTAATEGTYLDPTTQGTGTTLGRTSEVLTKNRFSPGTSFKSTDAWANTQKLDGSGHATSNASSFGVYDKKFSALAMTELQDVAEQLLLNAVGDKSSPFGDKDAATFDTGAGGILGTQLGISRDSYSADTDFRPAHAIQAARGSGRTATDNVNGSMPKNAPEEDLSENKDYKRTSFGVLNNHLEPFAPALPTSMILLAAVAAITAIIASIVLALIIDVLGAVVSLISGNGLGGGMSPDATYQIFGDSNDPSKLSMGAAFGSNDHSDSGLWASIYRLFNLPPLEAEYDSFFYFTAAATIGSLEFFIGNSLSGSFMMPQILTNSAGYYVVVVRNALRDMEQISDAASDMGGGGVTGAIEGFFGLIDAFTSSATFKFMTTMIQIGDRIMTGPSLKPSRDNNGRVIDGVLRENQSSPTIITDLGKTIRMKSGNRKLSYAFSVLPQIYLRPTETFAYHTLTPSGDAKDPFMDSNDAEIAGVAQFAKQGVQSTDVIISKGLAFGGGEKPPAFWNRLTYIENGRIPTRFRQELENELDAYYMPFYFHDLRTNEIIPLPAFVSAISDSFSPKYSESTSFGRMDAVQIYGGTTRKIGFSFYMVSTSPEDYSALYYGINKLVSLVYPQWGGGTEITNAAGETFQIPYSYVQTASPLIRLRLGELFASNRTPETVRRLFGANMPSFSVPDPNKSDEPAPPTKTYAEPGTTPFFPAHFEAIVSAGRSAAIDPTVSTLILATQVANAGGEAVLYNGCAPTCGGGEGDTAISISGGAQNLDGESILLPTGINVLLPVGITLPAVEWNLASYKKSRWSSRGSRTLSEPWSAKIINYYMRGAPRTAPGEPPKGGYLRNKLYYVVELNVPVVPEAKWPYLIVPIESVSWPGRAAPLDPNPQILPNPIPIPPIPGAPPPDAVHTDYQFFENNVIVKTMEESGGAGIAGAITSLDFDWNEAPWETSAALGRAPKYVKVTLSFSPIHDEPLGLNPDGSLRAAAYPVGDVIGSIMGERFGLPGRLPRSGKLDAIKQARQIIADAGLPPPPPPAAAEDAEG